MYQQQHRARDTKKQRQEYLSKLAQAQSMAGLGMGIAVVCGVMTLAVLVVGLPKLGPDINVDLGFLLCLLAFGGITRYGWRMHRLHSKRATSIPVVPPVREQVATLPAEEILVRGASEPGATPDELLRAANGTKSSSPDQLLRAHIGKS